MQYPPTSDSSDVPAPSARYVTSDESSQHDRPGDQCRALSVLGHRCPRPADVQLAAVTLVAQAERGLPADYCLLHVFAYLTVAVEMGLDDTITLGPLS